jgi:dTDP-4-amino-4,6-dideoxygalactose transaminase
MIPLFHPYISWRSIWEVNKVLLKGRWIGEGPKVKQFEYEFGKRFRFGNVVALNSGTSALEIAYELAGIGPGDDVITPVLTCTATNIPLVRRGCNVVFADIDYDLNISVEDVKKKITDKTKAIIFVHFGGNNRGLAELVRLCKANSITLIEDAAQAVGSPYWGKADFTCVSLQAIKTLTSGDGGFLICEEPEMMRKAKRLRWYGYDRDAKQKSDDTDLAEAGYKMHMSDITAAIGLGNLHSIEPIIAHRARLAEIYESYNLFAHSWLAGGFTSDYETLKKKYADNGIEIGQYHFPNSRYTLFKDYPAICPLMDELKDKYFFVPYHHRVSVRNAHKIGKIFQEHGQA